MKPENKKTEHINPRKTFGVSPKKVKYDANTREAQEEIEDYKRNPGARGTSLVGREGNFVSDLPSQCSRSNLN